MLTINNFNFLNKKALIRVDFNIPFNHDKKEYDLYRIKSTIPTIKKILKDGGKVILISHLKNPKGKKDKRFSLNFIIPILSEMLNINVKFSKSCIGRDVVNLISNMNNGDVVLLENLRFYSEELTSDKNFAKSLSKLGDIYVNDAFSVSHRDHASITKLPNFFNNKCVGYLMLKELKSLNNFLNKSNKPVTVVLGGSKISTKIPIINSLINFADYILIGGAMANTFIKSDNGNLGDSIVDNDLLFSVKNIITKCKKYKKTKLFIPLDVKAGNDFIEYFININSYCIPLGWKALDLGIETLNLYKKILLVSKTVLWNGPMGVFENPNFQYGTFTIADLIANLTKNNKIYSLIGGGDSVSALKKAGYSYKNYNFVSTGGGAMLKFLEKKELLGITSIL